MLDLRQGIKQFISFSPARYFPKESTQVLAAGNDQLQLQTFHIKPKLVDSREDQQTKPIPNPPKTIPIGDNPDPAPPASSPTPKQPTENKPVWGTCHDVEAVYIPQKCGAPPSSGPELVAYSECLKQAKKEFYSKYTCSDSPLYLYGASGTNVTVTVHTPIFNSNAKQDAGVYDMTLGNNGEMFVSGQMFQGIEYDYTPAIQKINPPTKGIVIPNEETGEKLREYASRLGLNTKETDDLVNYGTSVVTGEYVFISFFDHETSHAILPITFDPKPDVYRNIVFYFKNLEEKPNFSIQPPEFETIVRKSFTAIEVSGMVD
jgi:hypothetical protein